jgi:hypothetical protein
MTEHDDTPLDVSRDVADGRAFEQMQKQLPLEQIATLVGMSVEEVRRKIDLANKGGK